MGGKKDGGGEGGGKRASLAMANMAEELAAAPKPEKAGEGAAPAPAIAVEEAPAERIEKDEKEVALDKLTALMSDKSALAKEIETAIKACRDVGVPDDKLADAEKRVKDQKEKAAAANELLEAIKNRDVDDLKTA